MSFVECSSHFSQHTKMSIKTYMNTMSTVLAQDFFSENVIVQLGMSINVFMLDKYLASLWQCQFFKRRPHGHGKVHDSHCDILRPTIIFSLYITSFNLLHKCSSISKVQKVVLNPSSQSSFQTPRLNRGSRKCQRCRT